MVGMPPQAQFVRMWLAVLIDVCDHREFVREVVLRRVDVRPYANIGSQVRCTCQEAVHVFCDEHIF